MVAVSETSNPVQFPFVALDRAVYVPDADTLVLADVHLGKARASNVDAPLETSDDVCDRLRSLLEAVAPSTVVVAGDFLHSFSWIPDGVEDTVESIIDIVEDAGAELVITPGNHDTMLDSIVDCPLPDAFELENGDTVVLHGHEEPDRQAKRYIVGHDHPAISIEGRKHPCFLFGPNTFRGADVVVVPAFTTLARGAKVNKGGQTAFQSPLVTDLDAFHPGVRDVSAGETLWFPPLGNCRTLL